MSKENNEKLSKTKEIIIEKITFNNVKFLFKERFYYFREQLVLGERICQNVDKKRESRERERENKNCCHKNVC